jgi:hypothetical protein
MPDESDEDVIRLGERDRVRVRVRIRVRIKLEFRIISFLHSLYFLFFHIFFNSCGNWEANVIYIYVFIDIT